LVLIFIKAKKLWYLVRMVGLSARTSNVRRWGVRLSGERSCRTTAVRRACRPDPAAFGTSSSSTWASCGCSARAAARRVCAGRAAPLSATRCRACLTVCTRSSLPASAVPCVTTASTRTRNTPTGRVSETLPTYAARANAR
jgi:hypothetical protein